jgi:hypothetical protein
MSAKILILVTLAASAGCSAKKSAATGGSPETATPDASATLTLYTGIYTSPSLCTPIFVERSGSDGLVSFADHDLSLTFSIANQGAGTNAQLFTDSACTTAGTSATLAKGRTVAAIYSKASQAQDGGSAIVSMTVPAGFASTNTQTSYLWYPFAETTETPGYIDYFGTFGPGSYVTDSQSPISIGIGACLLLPVVLRSGPKPTPPDARAPIQATADTTLSLTLSGSAAAQIYSDSGCTTPVTSVVIPKGAADGYAYVMTPAAGAFTLNASAPSGITGPAALNFATD